MLFLQMLAMFAIAFSIQAIFSYKTRGIPSYWYELIQVGFMMVIAIGAFFGLATFAYDVHGVGWLEAIAILSAMLGIWFGSEVIPLVNSLVAERRLQAFVASQERHPIMGDTHGTQSHG